MKKVALVTGSNRGIGLEVVRQLAQRDITVVLSSRREKDGEKALQQINNPNIHYHQLDVNDQTSVDQIREYITRTFGRLDILVNNAAINYDTWHQAASADLSEIQETIDTNLLGPWRLAQAFIPLMKKNRYGRIVNVSSGSGALTGMGGGTPGYSVSKASLNVLTIKLARELKSQNILVNSVCPGWVRTEMGGASAPRSVEEGAETIVWAALLPDSGVTGKFLRDKREIPF